jgi:hypothetical protein
MALKKIKDARYYNILHQPADLLDEQWILLIPAPYLYLMLQNRVDPQGNMISTSARGAWMGNRGQLHDSGKHILRPFKLKAWLICLLEFKGRRRQVMAPNRYTELFFMDEATAFSAGHRPCFECRRADYNRFKSLWLKGNPEYGFNEKTSFKEIDEVLHKERIDPKRNKITYTAPIKDLPDGTFIQIEGQPYLLANKMIYHWTPAGYEKGIPQTTDAKVEVLTPKSTVNTFRAGYRPQMGV